MCRLYIAGMDLRLFYHLKFVRVKWDTSQKNRSKFRLHGAIFHNVRTGVPRGCGRCRRCRGRCTPRALCRRRWRLGRPHRPAKAFPLRGRWNGAAVVCRGDPCGRPLVRTALRIEAGIIHPISFCSCRTSEWTRSIALSPEGESFISTPPLFLSNRKSSLRLGNMGWSLKERARLRGCCPP